MYVFRKTEALINQMYNLIYIYIYTYIWEFKTLLTLLLKIQCSYMHIIMPSSGEEGRGGLYFIVSVTRSVVVLFLVLIGAVLLLRKHFALYTCMLCFRRTLWCFYGMIISVFCCRQSNFSYNVESSFAE
jgi:hypothetical protein